MLLHNALPTNMTQMMIIQYQNSAYNYYDKINRRSIIIMHEVLCQIMPGPVVIYKHQIMLKTKCMCIPIRLPLSICQMLVDQCMSQEQPADTYIN